MDFHGPSLSPVLFGSHLLLVDIISARVSPKWNAKPHKGQRGLCFCCATPLSYALRAVIRTCRTTQKNGCFIVQTLNSDAQRLVSGSEYTVHWCLPEASSSCQADHLTNVSKYFNFYCRLSFLFLLVHTVWSIRGAWWRNFFCLQGFLAVKRGMWSGFSTRDVCLSLESGGSSS